MGLGVRILLERSEGEMPTTPDYVSSVSLLFRVRSQCQQRGFEIAMDDFENAGNLTITEIVFFPTVDFTRMIWGTQAESGTLTLLGSTPTFYTTTDIYTSPTYYTQSGFLLLSTDCEIVTLTASATATAKVETSATLPGFIQSIKGKIKGRTSSKGVSFVNSDSTVSLFASENMIAPSKDSLEKLTLKIFNTANDWYLGLASFPDLVISSTPDSLQAVSKNDVFFIVQSTSSDILEHSVLVGTDTATIACFYQYKQTDISIEYIETSACYQANYSNASFVGGKSDILGDVLFLFSANAENDSIVSHAAQFTAPMLLRGMDSESTNKDVLEYNNFDIEVKFGWREIIII
jgi:hypothetical protein